MAERVTERTVVAGRGENWSGANVAVVVGRDALVASYGAADRLQRCREGGSAAAASA